MVPVMGRASLIPYGCCIHMHCGHVPTIGDSDHVDDPKKHLSQHTSSLPGKIKNHPSNFQKCLFGSLFKASNIFYRVATFWRSGSLLNPWLLWQCLPAFQFFDKKNLRPSKKAQGRSYLEKHHKPAVSFPACRIIPVSKWVVNPICKPFRPFGRGTTLLRGLTNHGYKPLTKWDDPPSGVYTRRFWWVITQ